MSRLMFVGLALITITTSTLSKVSAQLAPADRGGFCFENPAAPPCLALMLQYCGQHPGEPICATDDDEADE